jgi:hypothetical protein
MRSRGYTLTEAIIASFLLLAALLVITRVFHAALRYGVWSENKAVATHLAEKRIAELRRWAMTHQDWLNPPSGNDPEHPGFTIETRLSEGSLASPSSALMEGRGEPRLFEDSYRRATVEVSWGAGSSLSLHTYLRDPRRGWRATNPITIAGAGTAAANEVLTLTATGHGPNGPIADLRFTFSVEPVYPDGALGTLDPSNDGFTVRFSNTLQTGTGPVSSVGQCRIYATAIYGGEERRGSSGIINLVP